MICLLLLFLRCCLLLCHGGRTDGAVAGPDTLLEHGGVGELEKCRLVSPSEELKANTPSAKGTDGVMTAEVGENGRTLEQVATDQRPVAGGECWEHGRAFNGRNALVCLPALERLYFLLQAVQIM